MRSKGTRVVKLDDIHANLFVRKELDQDWACYLGELIEDGVEMNELIEVVEKDGYFELVEGRHRREGYILARVTEVKVKLLEFDSDVELISYAYRANTGGKKPPTPADTEHTIMTLLEKGETMKAIGELLGLPASIARKYVSEVKSRMNRAKLRQAIDAIADKNLTVANAAEQYGVDPEKLKEALSGSRRRWKESKKGVQKLQSAITFSYKSLASKNGSMLKKILQRYQDSDVSAEQVREIIMHLESCQKKSTRAIEDWRDRFKAISAGKNGQPSETA